MKETYKKPLTIKEQIEYLKNEKKVRYNIIKEPTAKDILTRYGYINVITPYKELFARKDSSGNIVRIDGKHIYDYDIEFSSYFQAYNDERIKYPTIYSNIMLFEETFNSIVSYEVIHFYQLDTYDNFLALVDIISSNARIRGFKDIKDNLLKAMDTYDDIYIFFDRLSLSQTITIYRCIDLNLQNKIFYSLKSKNSTLGYGTLGTFEDVLKRIVKIRNCIFHFNSLAILIEYYDVKTKQRRNASDKAKYKKVIAKLS